jgi:hypothetical protein
LFITNIPCAGLPLTEKNECIILGFGDSVINGGTIIDQDSLATTITENQLQNRIGNGVRFLNISAPSWGPDNCAAYLNKYGSFNARMLVLFVSSHDAHDNMTLKKWLEFSSPILNEPTIGGSGGNRPIFKTSCYECDQRIKRLMT